MGVLEAEVGVGIVRAGTRTGGGSLQRLVGNRRLDMHNLCIWAGVQDKALGLDWIGLDFWTWHDIVDA